MEPSNWVREISLLSMADKYTPWLAREFTRLKDFLAVRLANDQAHYATVVLQDGGALKDSLLAEFGPEVWEDFQNEFLDPGK